MEQAGRQRVGDTNIQAGKKTDRPTYPQTDIGPHLQLFVNCGFNCLAAWSFLWAILAKAKLMKISAINLPLPTRTARECVPHGLLTCVKYEHFLGCVHTG